MSLELAGALNVLAGTTDLESVGAANAAIGRIDAIEANAVGGSNRNGLTVGNTSMDNITQELETDVSTPYYYDIVALEFYYTDDGLLRNGGDKPAALLPTGQLITIFDDKQFAWADEVVSVDSVVTKALFTAKGQIVAATASGAVAVLTAGTNGYTLVYDSTTSTGLKVQDGVSPRQYAAKSASVTIAPSVGTETTIWTQTLPATPAADTLFLVRFSGDFFCNSATTITIKVKIGGVAVLTLNGGTIATSANRRHYMGELELSVGAGATTEDVAVKIMGVSGTGDTNNTTAPVAITGSTVTPAAESLTTAKALAMTVQWGTPSATTDWHNAYAHIIRHAPFV